MTKPVLMSVTVQIPAEWVDLWEQFDWRFDQLAKMDSVSSMAVGTFMRIGLSCPCTRHPAWLAWAALKHHAVGTSGIRDLLWDIYDARSKSTSAPTVEAGA